MKKEKILSALTAAALSFSCVSVTAFADSRNDFSDEEILASSVKPVITSDKITLTVDEAKSKPTQSINISVNGADKEYSSAELFVMYDNRLTLSNEDIHAGPAVSAKLGINTGYLYSPAFTDTMNVVSLWYSDSKNNGSDGVMWSLDFTLPSDISEGDIFPIDIIDYADENTKSVFLDSASKNMVMQAYAFLKGIYNENNPNLTDEPIYNTPYDGYIYIKPEEHTTTTTTTTTATTTTETTTTTTSATTTTDIMPESAFADSIITGAFQIHQEISAKAII